MNQYEMKEQISKVFDDVSFRKFGNAFRKHIDPFFKSENHVPHFKNITWNELASYMIGDGTYNVTEEQYKNFMKEIKGL